MKELLAILVSVVILQAQGIILSEDKPSGQEDLTIRIQQLIKQLGDDNLKTREKAQKELENLANKYSNEQLNLLESLLKNALEDDDPEINRRAKIILKIVDLRRRVRFSESFLKEFPDIYRQLAKLDTPGKFEFLQQILNQAKDPDKISRQDIAYLIGEILLEDGKGLTSEQKLTLLYISTGENLWNSYIPESTPYIVKLLKDRDRYVRGWAGVALVELGQKGKIIDKIYLAMA